MSRPNSKSANLKGSTAKPVKKNADKSARADKQKKRIFKVSTFHH